MYVFASDVFKLSFMFNLDISGKAKIRKVRCGVNTRKQSPPKKIRVVPASPPDLHRAVYVPSVFKI